MLFKLEIKNLKKSLANFVFTLFPVQNASFYIIMSFTYFKI